MYVRDLFKIIDRNTKVFISKDNGTTFEWCVPFDVTQWFLEFSGKVEICGENKIRVCVEPIPDNIPLLNKMEFKMRPCPVSVFDKIVGTETTEYGEIVTILMDSDYEVYAVKESTMKYIMENCGRKLEIGQFAMSFTKEKVRGYYPCGNMQGKPRDFWGNASL